MPFDPPINKRSIFDAAECSGSIWPFGYIYRVTGKRMRAIPTEFNLAVSDEVVAQRATLSFWEFLWFIAVIICREAQD